MLRLQVAGYRVRYFIAFEVVDAPFRGLAGN